MKQRLADAKYAYEPIIAGKQADKSFVVMATVLACLHTQHRPTHIIDIHITVENWCLQNLLMFLI